VCGDGRGELHTPMCHSFGGSALGSHAGDGFPSCGLRYWID